MMTSTQRPSDPPVTVWGLAAGADTSQPPIEDSAAAAGQTWPLGGDFEKFFNPFESRRMRSALIDLQSLECKASWSIANCVAVAEDRLERGWNTASPSFAKVVEHLSQAPLGEVVVKQVGLQRCVYFWRIEPQLVVATELRSLGRLSASDVDPSLVKEICGAAMRLDRTVTAFRPPDAASADSSGTDVRLRSARSPWVKLGWACVVSCAPVKPARCCE